MDLLAMGRLLGVVRLRRGLRQTDVGAAAGMSASAIARHERGHFSSLSGLERHAAALELRVNIRLLSRGGELDRLLDDEHAAIVETVARALKGAGHSVQPEVSFSEWGERGRYDLLCLHRPTGVLTVVEAKSELTSIQDLLGTLDAKRRLAPAVAQRLGWSAGAVKVVLAVAATSRNHRVVASHPALFADFEKHLLTAHHLSNVSPAKMLLWVTPMRAGRVRWVAGRRRTRRACRCRA